MRRCNNCNGETPCSECKNQVNENKEFEANLNLLKRDVSNQFGHRLPYYILYILLKRIFLFQRNTL